MTEFGANQYMVRQAKNLVNQHGILATPNQSKGRPLVQSTEKLIKEFYESDEISRLLPGAKDYVSVRDQENNLTKKQKRLVLCNLREAHAAFRNQHPIIKVGFSTFCDRRPRECVLAGDGGTHSVCVCTKHQNFKLRFDAVRKIFEVGQVRSQLARQHIKH